MKGQSVVGTTKNPAEGGELDLSPLTAELYSLDQGREILQLSSGTFFLLVWSGQLALHYM